MKSMHRTSSDDRLIDQIATTNSRTLSNQRFVMSEQKERKRDLNEIFDVVDKLGIRFDDQTAMTKEQRDEENLSMVEDAIDKASHSSMNNQRFALSSEKIKQLSLTELVNSVEKLAKQRMPVRSLFLSLPFFLLQKTHPQLSFTTLEPGRHLPRREEARDAWSCVGYCGADEGLVHGRPALHQGSCHQDGNDPQGAQRVN